MLLPVDVEDAAERLSRIYGDALHHVRTELASISEESSSARLRRRLRALSATLERLLRDADQQARMWIDSTLPRLYERGLGDFVAGVAAVGTSSTDDVLTSFAMPSRPAIERLAAGLTDDLLSATRHVAADTKRAIRAAVRSASLAKVTEGRSLRDAQRAVLRELEDLGIGSVRYRNGTRMPIDAYAAMSVRTTTAHAYNFGMLDAGRANGVAFFEVFDGPGCGWESHNSGGLANGTIRSAADCEAHPSAHPHCRRSFGPRPDLTGSEGNPSLGGGVVTGPSLPEFVPLRPRAQARLDRRRARLARRQR